MPFLVQRNPRNWLVSSVVLVAIPVIAFMVLGACAGGKPSATPTPTRTPRPTFTPVKATATEASALRIAAATAVPAPTQAVPTSTPLPRLTVAPTATPVPPTVAPAATPRPTVPPPTAPPAAAPRAPAPTAAPAAPPPPPDPCAGIGGDGCKWRVTGGPAFGPNGGQELKLQLLFIHGGIDGGQPQGSYFIVLEKDGQNLKIPDSIRSITGATSQGSLGKFNYEYALGLDRLPGNTVAGNYTLWVLDGNGERDSRNVTFAVPADQGQLWIQFDQS